MRFLLSPEVQDDGGEAEERLPVAHGLDIGPHRACLVFLFNILYMFFLTEGIHI